MISPVARRGSQACFWASVPPVSSARARISGRVMSEPPAPSEPRGQLLGGDDHAEVVGPAAGGVAAVGLADRQAEGAHLAQPRDDVLGDVVVGAVDVLGPGGDAVLGEAAEGVLHHLEVGVEVAGAGVVGQVGQELRIAVAAHEVPGAVERRPGRPPQPVPSEDAAGHVRSGVGHERSGEAGLVVALGPVVQQRPRRLDRGGGVGQVVGEDLLLVDRAGPGRPQGLDALADHARRRLDDRSGFLEIDVSHGRRGYRPTRSPAHIAGLRRAAPTARPLGGRGGRRRQLPGGRYAPRRGGVERPPGSAGEPADGVLPAARRAVGRPVERLRRRLTPRVGDPGREPGRHRNLRAGHAGHADRRDLPARPRLLRGSRHRPRRHRRRLRVRGRGAVCARSSASSTSFSATSRSTRSSPGR